MVQAGLKLLPINFDRQVIPGSFEYALCHLVDNKLDLSVFHACDRNDIEAYDASSCATAPADRPAGKPPRA
jgi:hypothetical protein